MKRLWALVLVIALAAFGAACGTNENNGGGGGGGNESSSEGGDSVDLTQGGDVRIAMVTHGDGGSFWAVAKTGAEDAAEQ